MHWFSCNSSSAVTHAGPFLMPYKTNSVDAPEILFYVLVYRFTLSLCLSDPKHNLTTAAIACFEDITLSLNRVGSSCTESILSNEICQMAWMVSQVMKCGVVNVYSTSRNVVFCWSLRRNTRQYEMFSFISQHNWTLKTLDTLEMNLY